MPRRPVDPAVLHGAALEAWYRRSPAEVEEERRAVARERREAFFGGPVGESGGAPAAGLTNAVSHGDDVLWMRNGHGGYSAVRTSGRAAMFRDEGAISSSALGLEDSEARLFPVGNPENRRLKREYIRKKGSWPQTPDGRDYDVSHIRAIADGGTNTLDNIEPMHPDEHRAKHKNEGDNRRFAMRRAIAKAFGGTVEPPANAPKKPKPPPIRGFGPLGIVTGLTGILSGRIRTDSFDNFVSDMMGVPSQEDVWRSNEEYRKRNHPKSKPGDVFI
jgi:hypothetical protein